MPMWGATRYQPCVLESSLLMALMCLQVQSMDIKPSRRLTAKDEAASSKPLLCPRHMMQSCPRDLHASVMTSCSNTSNLHPGYCCARHTMARSRRSAAQTDGYFSAARQASSDAMC